MATGNQNIEKALMSIAFWSCGKQQYSKSIQKLKNFDNAQNVNRNSIRFKWGTCNAFFPGVTAAAATAAAVAAFAADAVRFWIPRRP